MLARKLESERKRKSDSIIKVKELKQQRLEVEALARKLELERKRKSDSIIQFQEAKKKRLEEQELVIKIKAEQKEKRKQDSIVKIKETEKSKIKLQENKEQENARLERIKFRNTCHYIVNEYDDYYKERNIKTTPYTVSRNLTIELVRQGRSVSVFINLSEDLGCASYLSSQRSFVKVKLENNKIITFYHSWNIECGDFSFKGKISSSQIISLKNSPIKSIKLQGTKYSQEIIDIDYKEFFIDKLKCIE